LGINPLIGTWGSTPVGSNTQQTLLRVLECRGCFPDTDVQSVLIAESIMRRGVRIQCGERETGGKRQRTAWSVETANGRIHHFMW